MHCARAGGKPRARVPRTPPREEPGRRSDARAPATMAFNLLLPATLVLVFDQLAKAFVVRRAAEWEWRLVGCGIKIRQVRNARGIQSFFELLAFLFLWVAVLAGVVFFLKQGYFFQTRAAQLGLGAALGGAASNVYDRLRRRAVIDFLDVGWWPVFNLADVGITLGAVVALWFVH